MFAQNIKAWDEKCYSSTEHLHLTVSFIWQHHQGKGQGKKEGKKKKSFLQSKKGGKLCLADSWPPRWHWVQRGGRYYSRDSSGRTLGDQEAAQEMGFEKKKILIMVLLSQSILCCIVITWTKLKRGPFLEKEVVIQTHESKMQNVFLESGRGAHAAYAKRRDGQTRTNEAAARKMQGRPGSLLPQ